MSKLLYRLGLACARRPKTVMVVWLIAVIAVVAVSRIVGDQTSNNLTLPGTDSTNATNLLESDLPDQANGSVPIVLHVDSGTLDSGANKQAVDATVKSLKNTDGVNSVLSPFSSKASDNLSKDKQTAYIAVTLGISSGDLDEDEANDIIAGADPAVKAGIQVEAGGYLGQEVSKPSTHVSEAIGIGVAVVILTLAFGTAVAMMLPISTAIIGLLLGLSLIGILGHAIEIPSIAPTLGTMIGLGVGIDYALFIVTRYKTRLQDGLPTNEAIARSCATSGSAVAFAGGTVVIALCSLAFANIPDRQRAWVLRGDRRRDRGHGRAHASARAARDPGPEDPLAQGPGRRWPSPRGRPSTRVGSLGRRGGEPSMARADPRGGAPGGAGASAQGHDAWPGGRRAAPGVDDRAAGVRPDGQFVRRGLERPVADRGEPRPAGEGGHEEARTSSSSSKSSSSNRLRTRRSSRPRRRFPS